MTRAARPQTRPAPGLAADHDELARRLEEAEETIRAIRSGAVDAVVVEESGGHRVYTLDAADRPYRLLVEQMQQGAATLHADGTIVYCNLSLAELLKVPHSRLCGGSLHDFIEPADRAIYENLLWQGQSRTGRGEARLRRSDGALVPSYLTFNALPRDCGAAIGVLVTDLTAQRHHEQLAASHSALRVSEERFRSLSNATASIVWTTDAAGEFVTDQPSWSAYTGQAWEQLRGSGWADAVHPDDRERIVSLWETARHTRTLYRSDGRLWHAPTSAYRHFEARGVAVPDADGSIREWVGQCVDVEANKRNEVHILSLVAALKDSDRRKEEFLATLAHELRGPLAPLRNVVELIERAKDPGEISPAMHATMKRQLEQIVRLVDDLLDVSRISHGKLELQRTPVDLATVVSLAVDGCRPVLDARRHELTVTRPAEGIRLLADRARLAQVVGNLLHNACKYTAPGGRISIEVESEGGQAVVRVRDSGIGIPADKLESVFEMFNQLDRSIERSEGGLGIGLNLVRRFVAMHGGTVQAFSRGAGHGTEFVVRLPLSSAEAGVPAPAALAGEAVSTRSRRILVVDDNTDSASTMAMLLTGAGNETRTAHDGLQAVATAERFRPDVVLLDLGLPKLNGFDACRRIRDEAWGRSMVLVALTGWGQETDRRKSKDAGFDHHLVKPVEFGALTRLLETLHD